MPQLTSVVLTDGTDSHTFQPRGVDNSGIATLVESTGVPIADKRLTISRSRTTQGREKVAIKFVLPVVQDVVVAGVSRPTVVRAAYANLDFSFDGASTTEERNDVRNMLTDLLAENVSASIIGDLETLY